MGATVAQLYITYPSTAGEPPRQLRGFRKVQLAPADSATVALPLAARDFSTWDAQSHSWSAISGVFELIPSAHSTARISADAVAPRAAWAWAPTRHDAPLGSCRRRDWHVRVRRVLAIEHRVAVCPCEEKSRAVM
eukprot:4831018-Prymnesium_polylepis.1